MRIYKSDDSPPDLRFTGLYCGDSMKGKTYNACTWPNPLVVSFDPDTQTARGMPGVWVVEVETWKDFTEGIMPAVRARKLGAFLKDRLQLTEEPLIETLVVDSISIAATKLVREIQGERPAMRQQDFGTLLNELTGITMQCVETSKERVPGEATYHVIFTTHLQQITDDSNVLKAVRPAVMGAFKDTLPKLFGFCFICDVQQETTIVDGKAQQVAKWVVRTTPPDRFHICGQRHGANDRRSLLPPLVGGTYPELCEAWGINKEDT